MNNLIRAFIYAIKTRRRFLIDGQYWNYGSFSSFFNISQGYFSPWLPSSSYCSKRRFVHFINYEAKKNYTPEHLTIGRDVDKGFSSLNLIMRTLEVNNQTLETKRIVCQYLWKRLNNQTRNFINQYANKIRLNDTTYGIHVRRGDKLIEEAKKIPIENYINGIEYFTLQYSQNGNICFQIKMIYKFSMFDRRSSTESLCCQ